MLETRELVFLYSRSFVPAALHNSVERQLPPGWRLHWLEQSDAAKHRLRLFERADYVVAYPGNPSAAELAAARRLKLFQMLSAGYDWLDLEAFRRAGIPVAANAGRNAVSTAEHTLLLMLAMLKHLPRHHNAVCAGQWPAMAHAAELRELSGKMVGLIGYGQIGRAVARRLQAFDARVIYHTRTLVDTAATDGLSPRAWVSLAELLSTADIISLHLPLTPQTRGMIGATELAAMRQGSYLVNTARGALVDEEALVQALCIGHLAGAALDVFEHEPLPLASRLAQSDRVVLTPHIGGVTLDAWRARLALAFENIQRVESGLAPLARIA